MGGVDSRSAVGAIDDLSVVLDSGIGPADWIVDAEQVSQVGSVGTVSNVLSR